MTAQLTEARLFGLSNNLRGKAHVGLAKVVGDYVDYIRSSLRDWAKCQTSDSEG